MSEPAPKFLDWHKPGQKVMLIKGMYANFDGIFFAVVNGISIPQQGVVYTIRDVEIPCAHCDTISLHLVEIQNRTVMARNCGGENKPAEIWFEAAAFRPVIARKTSIETFQEIRRGVERRVNAPDVAKPLYVDLDMLDDNEGFREGLERNLQNLRDAMTRANAMRAAGAPKALRP